MRESTHSRQDTDKTKKVNAQVYCWKYYFKFLNRHLLQLMRRENATKRKMRKIKGFKNKKMRITVSHIRGEMR